MGHTCLICPGALLQKMATIRDPSGAAGQVDFRIANADDQ